MLRSEKLAVILSEAKDLVVREKKEKKKSGCHPERSEGSYAVCNREET